MYAEGFTVSRILAHCQMSLGTLYACLDGAPFGRDGELFAPLPRRRNNLLRRWAPREADTSSLCKRLVRTAERQVRQIETQLSARDLSGAERERKVRMLTSLTRVLREIEKFEKKRNEHGDPIDTDVPSFREEFNRRAGVLLDGPTKRRNSAAKSAAKSAAGSAAIGAARNNRGWT